MGKEEDPAETEASEDPGTGVVQIDRSIGEKAWSAIERFDVWGQGWIDVATLDAKQVVELVDILRTYGFVHLADEVAAAPHRSDDEHEDDDVVPPERIRAQLSALGVEKVPSTPIYGDRRTATPTRSTTSTTTGSGSTPETGRSTSAVDPPAILELLQGPYRDHSRTYRGPSAEVKAALGEDPLVALLFPSVAVFLDVVGWDVMCRRGPDMDDVVTVEIAILKGKEGVATTDDQVSINTVFPYGLQDSTVGYDVRDGRFVIHEFLRHRSRKIQGAPGHMFVAMIEQQARGVAALGPQCGYRSSAIKADDSGDYGYNVWPKMGFDADVPDSCLTAMLADLDLDLTPAVGWLRTLKAKNITPRFTHMFTVTTPELYKQLGLLWQKHGTAVEVWFDPRPKSASWKALATYKAMRKFP